MALPEPLDAPWAGCGDTASETADGEPLCSACADDRELHALRDAARAALPALELLGDYLPGGNAFEGKTGIAPFDRCRLIWDIKAALGTMEPRDGRIGPGYDDWLTARIRTVHRALCGLLGTPGAHRTVLRMEYDRLQGLIEAHLIVAGVSKQTGESRKAVIAHAWSALCIDLDDLAAKIDRRMS